MATKPYSAREIDVMFKNLVTTLNVRLDDQDKVLDKIVVQTTKTNGHLRVHDRLIWLVTGGIAVIGWLYAQNFISCIGTISCNK